MNTAKESYQLVETRQIPHSPLTLVKTDAGYFLTMGNNRLSDFAETEEKAMEYLQTDMYNIIVRMIWVIFDDIKNLTK